jgi:hypothetical protein
MGGNGVSCPVRIIYFAYRALGERFGKEIYSFGGTSCPLEAGPSEKRIPVRIDRMPEMYGSRQISAEWRAWRCDAE